MMTKRKLGWSANQLKFQEWLATPRLERSPPTQIDVAEVIGVTNVTLSRWKALPGFEEAVVQKARDAMQSRLPDVYGALTREAEKGSYQHIKLIMEMTKQYFPAMGMTGADGGPIDMRIQVVRGYDDDEDTFAPPTPRAITSSEEPEAVQYAELGETGRENGSRNGTSH